MASFSPTAGASSPSRGWATRCPLPRKKADAQPKRFRSMASNTAGTLAGARSSDMPELPEAETIAADLRRHLIGRKVKRVIVTHADVLAPDLDAKLLDRSLRGRSIEAVGR